MKTLNEFINEDQINEVYWRPEEKKFLKSIIKEIEKLEKRVADEGKGSDNRSEFMKIVTKLKNARQQINVIG